MTRLWYGFSVATKRTWPELFRLQLPVLVSFALDYRHKAVSGYRPLLLDSGAYTAFTTGVPIDRDALLAEQVSGRYEECVALDEVGSADRSRENWLWSRDRGSDAWPTFHRGEPWELLEEYCAGSWKVGIGGLVAPPCTVGDRISFLTEVFRRAWPHRFHLFGLFDLRILQRFPFHSADSVIWGLQAKRFGLIHLPAAGSKHAWVQPQGRKLATQGVAEASIVHRLRSLTNLRAELASRWSLALGEAEKAAPRRCVQP